MTIQEAQQSEGKMVKVMSLEEIKKVAKSVNRLDETNEILRIYSKIGGYMNGNETKYCGQTFLCKRFENRGSVDNSYYLRLKTKKERMKEIFGDYVLVPIEFVEGINYDNLNEIEE